MNLTLAPESIDPALFDATLADPEFADGGDPMLSTYARCSDGHGTLSFLFFSEDELELARAKAICRTCGLQDACLSGAIGREEPYGVWGGKLVLDGVPVEFQRKRGRPPKNPKPILVVDEAPIPAHLVAS
jgi:WhiB family redox-sensing transcriptional regulator